METRVELQIERVAPGGDGVAHVDGLVVFVPRTFPGDRVSARLVRGKEAWAKAVEVEVLVPAATRVASPCAHSQACGGCPWMGWDVAAQRAAKHELLADLLRRMGRHSEWPEIHVVAGDDLGWRSKAEWLTGAWRAGAVLGYRARGTNDLVEVDDCPILAPRLRELLLGLKNGTVALPREARSATACLDESATGAVPGASFSAQDRADAPLDVRDADRRVRRMVQGLPLEFPLRGFQQGNAQLLSSLVDRATSGLDGDEVLDLYSGSGLFALPLAARGRVVHGIELDAVAVRTARINALRLGLEGARFTHSDVQVWLSRQARIPDAVLVDPPRAGLGEAVVKQLVRLRPTHIRHVSCDPATLARDAGALVRAGWNCLRIDLLDMFPHTPHMEVVMHLERPQ